MKLWKRWTAAVLAAAMALLLLAACGPSGPSAPDAPDTPGSSETGKDPTDEKTEEQKAAAVVDTLNTVRKNYGNNTPLELNEQACAFAKEMAQVQLDGVNGKYGKNPSTNRDYTAACANVRKKMVGEKKGSLVKKEATLVGVGVVHNTDPATMENCRFMVVVMTY